MIRTGVFGGCFDPIHMGHLMLAEMLRERCALNRVIFVPTWRPAHRAAVADFETRLELVRRAIAPQPLFEVSDIERSLPEPSYTIQTLKALASADQRLILMTGADAFASIAQWHRAGELLAGYDIAVAARPGTADPREGVSKALGAERLARVLLYDNLQVQISSTEIRQRLASGRSVVFRVPEAVRERICQIPAYRAQTD